MVTWRQPSNLAGVPVGPHNGILGVGKGPKNAVRMTFPKGVLEDIIRAAVPLNASNAKRNR